jgi:hypothetical protein
LGEQPVGQDDQDEAKSFYVSASNFDILSKPPLVSKPCFDIIVTTCQNYWSKPRF